MMMTLLQAAGK